MIYWFKIFLIINDDAIWDFFVNASHHKSISIEVYGGDFSSCLEMIHVHLLILLRTNFLDEEWFGYETAGTLVVGWEGGPAKPVEPRGGKRLEDEEEAELARLHTSRLDPLDLAEHESRPKTTATGIEIAAALATGTECWSIGQLLKETDLYL